MTARGDARPTDKRYPTFTVLIFAVVKSKTYYRNHTHQPVNITQQFPTTSPAVITDFVDQHTPPRDGVDKKISTPMATVCQKDF